MPASDSAIEERRKTIPLPMEFQVQGNRVSTFDTAEQKRIWRTLDIHILPCVTLLYILSYL